MSDVNEKKDNVIISEDVLIKMIGVAACEVPGVSAVGSYTSNLSSVLKLDRPIKPISIYKNGNTMGIDVSVIVKNGFMITNVAKKVQKNIKETIQNMSGIVVTKVNVNIIDIDFKSDNK